MVFDDHRKPVFEGVSPVRGPGQEDAFAKVQQFVVVSLMRLASHLQKAVELFGHIDVCPALLQQPVKQGLSLFDTQAQVGARVAGNGGFVDVCSSAHVRAFLCVDVC